MRNAFLYRLIFILFIPGLIACAGEENKRDNRSKTKKDTTAVKEKNKEQSADSRGNANAESDEISYVLPSPLQIATIFKRSGLEYNAELPNDPGNASNYNSKFIKKVNFGIYTADLAYTVLNEQNQAAINYVKTLSDLSRSLWMINIFESASTLKRFESNIGNLDSLTVVISDFQMQLDDHLQESGLSENSLTIFAGAWIESMYIGSKVVEKKNNEKLMMRLAEQSRILNNLLSEMQKDKYEINGELLSDLKKIDEHFKKFEGLENSDDEDPEYKLSDEALNSLARDMEQIRNKYVKG